MKLKPVFTITALAASLAFSMSAIASDSQPEAMPCATQQTQAQQKGEAQTQASTQDIQKTEALAAKKINPAQDKSRHYHPRDGKT